MRVRAVLTAAHCILVGIGIPRQRTSVIVAAHKLDDRGTSDIEVEVQGEGAGEPAETIRRHAAKFWVRASTT